MCNEISADRRESTVAVEIASNLGIAWIDFASSTPNNSQCPLALSVPSCVLLYLPPSAQSLHAPWRRSRAMLPDPALVRSRSRPDGSVTASVSELSPCSLPSSYYAEVVC